VAVAIGRVWRLAAQLVPSSEIGVAEALEGTKRREIVCQTVLGV